MNHSTVATNLEKGIFIFLLAAGSTSVSAQEIVATPGLWSSGNPFLDALIVALGIATIWSFFYWGLYPRLLPSFGEVAARGIFWSGTLLYIFTWWFLCGFTFYTIGYFYSWFQLILLPILGLLSIWFLLSFVRR